MLQFYPLQPVVTSNQQFAQTYDDNPQSISLTSGCITPDNMAALLSRGVKFDLIVLLNGEGEDLLRHHLSHTSDTHACSLKSIMTEENPSAVMKIHALIQGNPSFFNMG